MTRVRQAPEIFEQFDVRSQAVPEAMRAASPAEASSQTDYPGMGATHGRIFIGSEPSVFCSDVGAFVISRPEQQRRSQPLLLLSRSFLKPAATGIFGRPNFQIPAHAKACSTMSIFPHLR